MTRRITLCLFVCSLVHLCNATSAAQETALSGSQGTMLWISDIHFDPFYGGEVTRLANDTNDGWRDHTEWGAIMAKMPGNSACSPSGSDANNFLLDKVLNRAAVVLNQKPDCILITGDFLSHNFSNDYFKNSQLPGSLTTTELHNRFIDQTMAYLALSVSRAFPNVPVIATLGNNDAYCGDYDIRGNSGFLINTRRTFQKYFLPQLSADFENVGGCYSTSIPGTKHTFVVLNSIPFISDYPESYRITGIPKLHSVCSPLRTVNLVDEYDWLTKTIDGCGASQKVWIACHIPPGVACYNGAQNWARPVADGGGQVPFVNRFRKYYLNQKNHFAGVLTGHSHAAEFKLIRDNDGHGPPVSFVLMAPSIGRNHRNNASFRVTNFDRHTLAINDYTTHWLDGSQSPPTWGTPFTFSKTYGQPDVSPQSLAAVLAAINSGKMAPSGMTYLDQYFYDYSTRNGAKNSRSRTHYKNALSSILGP